MEKQLDEYLEHIQATRGPLIDWDNLPNIWGMKYSQGFNVDPIARYRGNIPQQRIKE